MRDKLLFVLAIVIIDTMFFLGWYEYGRLSALKCHYEQRISRKQMNGLDLSYNPWQTLEETPFMMKVCQ